LDRYITRQIFWLFLASLVGLVLFTSLTLAVQLSDLILSRSQSFLTVFKLLALKIPDFLGFALPMALVVSTFIILARLVHDQEILAFQLGGYSLKRIVYPLIVIGVLVSIATFTINNYLVPWANLQYREEIYRITQNNPLPQIQSDLFFKDPGGRMIYVGRYLGEIEGIEDVVIFDPDGLELSGVSTGGNYPELLSSRSGSLSSQSFQLSDGYAISLDDSGRVKYSMKFNQLNVDIGEEIENFVVESRKTNEMGLRELWERSRATSEASRASSDLKFAFHSRLSQPLAGLVFVLFSAPLSLMLRHRSKAVGIILGLISVGGYQGVLLWAKSSVRRTGLEPFIGAWLPDIIFGALGLVLFISLDNTTTSTVVERLRAMLNPVSRP